MPSTAAEKTWENCLTQISDQISKQSFQTWFAPITPIELERDDTTARLRLAVPDAFHTEWLESHYAQVLRRVAAEIVGQRTDIAYEVTPEEEESEPDLFSQPPARRKPDEASAARMARSSPAEQRARRASPGGPSPRTPHRPRRPPFTTQPSRTPQPPVVRKPVPVVHSRLKPEYTFESFIEGDCNRLARSASVAISQNPGGTSFNPFMVYGGVGLGKTHIVQAVGNFAMKEEKAERVLYVSSEQFTSQFVRSIQENRVSDFSNFYRQIDLLIVDDVQFFGGKEKTQEEFFHVFNELHQTGRQIILCADRPPSEISGIEERLLSRFKWGLSADVQPPDLETRIAILQHKADQHEVSLQPDVIDFVAERIRANIRQLEGALLRLSAHADLYRTDLDVSAAKEILRDMIEDYQVRLEIEDIQRSVAQYYGIASELLSAKTRKREIVTARHVAMHFCKQLTTHSLKSIGLRFGGRDHSTVIHACNTIEDRLELEPAFREEVDEIHKRLERPSAPRGSRHNATVGMA